MDFTHQITTGSEEADLSVVPITPVIVAKPYEMMQNDVTYKQWSDVMGFEHHPKHYENCGEDCPVIGVTFWSILRFANCQSLREGLAPCYELNDCLSEPDCVSSFDASKFACEEAVVEAASCSGFRLASVGEWELATRGGTNSCLWNRAPDKTFGPCNEFDPLGRVAWFCANSFVDWEGCADCVGFQGDAQADCCGPHPVGQLEANPFGIKDPLGNVGHLMGTLADAAKPDAFPGKVRVDPGHPSAYARWSIGLDQPCSFRAPNSSCCLNIRTSGYLDYIQNGPIGFRLVRTVE
jgi:formylglycine-generating enzyme required for sulfatase activity